MLADQWAASILVLDSWFALHVRYIPYLLDQTPRLLFISSCNFVWLLFERCLLNSVLLVKSFVNVRASSKASFNKELQCSDLVLKQTFQLLDQPPLCYKAVPTRHLQSVSSFSSPMTSHVDRPPCLKTFLDSSLGT